MEIGAGVWGAAAAGPRERRAPIGPSPSVSEENLFPNSKNREKERRDRKKKRSM